MEFKIGQTVDVTKAGYIGVKPTGVVRGIVRGLKNPIGYKVDCTYIDEKEIAVDELFFRPDELKLVEEQ